MANSLVGLESNLHVDNLINEPLWAPFEMDLMEDCDETLSDNLPCQFFTPSATSQTVAADTVGCGGTLGNNTEWRPTDDSAPLGKSKPNMADAP